LIWFLILNLVMRNLGDEESGNVPANTNNESLQTESDVTEPEPEHKSTSSTSANNNVIPQSNIIQKPKPSNNTSKGTSEVEPQELVLKNETPPPQKNEGLNKSNETPPPQKNEGLNKSNETKVWMRVMRLLFLKKMRMKVWMRVMRLLFLKKMKV